MCAQVSQASSLVCTVLETGYSLAGERVNVQASKCLAWLASAAEQLLLHFAAFIHRFVIHCCSNDASTCSRLCCGDSSHSATWQLNLCTYEPCLRYSHMQALTLDLHGNDMIACANNQECQGSLAL